MNVVITSIDSSTGGVKISWSSPVSNGEAVTAYKVEIGSGFNTELVNCDGS
jgi:hypothetical protein